MHTDTEALTEAPTEAPTARATCTARLSAEIVDAGAGLTLVVSQASEPPSDLSGHPVQVIDHNGNVVCETMFSEFDGERSMTARLQLRAPIEEGSFTWVVSTAGPDEDAAGVTPFSFEVKAHATNVLVWGVPAAVEAGTRFRALVGMKCSCGCNLQDRGFTVFDANGGEVAAGRLGPEPWPGTAALYATEVELPAPEAEGAQNWQVAAAAFRGEQPHAAGAAKFGVIFVPGSDCMVTVEAIDNLAEVPLPGLQVVMHPYRSATDSRGIAELRVAKGEYTLFVTGRRQLPYRETMIVEGDVRATVRLIPEPPSMRE